MVRCCVRLSVVCDVCLVAKPLTEKLSKEANRVARPLPCCTNSDPLRPPIPPKRGDTIQGYWPSDPSQNCPQTSTWSLLTACRNLPTPYRMVPSPTLYGHLFSQNMGSGGFRPPPPAKNCTLAGSTVGYPSDSWASVARPYTEPTRRQFCNTLKFCAPFCYAVVLLCCVLGPSPSRHIRYMPVS